MKAIGWHPKRFLAAFRRGRWTWATLITGAAGGGLMALTGLPGAWITGSMLAVASAALSGMPTRLPVPLVSVAFVCIGVSMGAGVTPETLARLPSWPVSLALVAVSVPIIAGAIFFFLTRRAKWDAPTAMLSALPGALSFLLALAPSTKADIPRVATLQSTRVAMLVAVLPVAAVWLSDPAPAQVAETLLIGLDGALLLAVGGIGAAILAHLLSVPAGLLVGGLAASAALHGFGLINGVIPEVVTVCGFVVLGTMIGTRFLSVTWSALAGILVVSLESFAIGATIAAAMALATAAITGLEVLKLLLAFAPGGLEAMVVLAFALDLDPAFVAAHHLARFLLIALLAPLVFQRLGMMQVAQAPSGDKAIASPPQGTQMDEKRA
ncbi:MAG: AbrB family transcriptional regulator [Pseudomonadota bacterium]